MGKLAVPALIAALDSERADFAATALGKIGDPSAFEALVALGPRGTLALGELGDPRAVPLLRERALTDGHAGQALYLLGAAQVLTELLPLWPVSSRWQVARYLGELGDPVAAEALLEQTRSDNESLRTEAALALGALADPRCLPALFAICGDGYSGVRAVSYARDVLRQHASQVPSEDLEAARNFAGAFVYETEEAVGFGSDPIVGTRDVDGSQVRLLATEEWARRHPQIHQSR